jgi:hypothetical protein
MRAGGPMRFDHELFRPWGLSSAPSVAASSTTVGPYSEELWPARREMTVVELVEGLLDQ